MSCSLQRARSPVVRAAGRFTRARLAYRADQRVASLPIARPGVASMPGARSPLRSVRFICRLLRIVHAAITAARGRAEALHSALRGRRNDEGRGFDLHRCRRLPRRTDVRSGLLRVADAGVDRQAQARRHERRRHHALRGAGGRHRGGVGFRRVYVVGSCGKRSWKRGTESRPDRARRASGRSHRGRPALRECNTAPAPARPAESRRSESGS